MKMFMKTALAICFLAEMLHADILRLRNGEVIEGRFISGSDAGIWFEKFPREAAVYPLTLVESVAFGAGFPSVAPSAAKQENTSVVPAKNATSSAGAFANRRRKVAQ